MLRMGGPLGFFAGNACKTLRIRSNFYLVSLPYVNSVEFTDFIARADRLTKPFNLFLLSGKKLKAANLLSSTFQSK